MHMNIHVHFSGKNTKHAHPSPCSVCVKSTLTTSSVELGKVKQSSAFVRRLSVCLLVFLLYLLNRLTIESELEFSYARMGYDSVPSWD